MIQIDFESLVTAIKSIKQETDYIKDYIFPVASAFFTSILGAVIAYATLRDQENIQIEKEKMLSANKWILRLEAAQTEIFAIKANYYNKINENPIQRAVTIPTIIFQPELMNFPFEDLAFIVPKNDLKTLEYPKWSQIPRIRAMLKNYNQVLIMWTKRNEINEINIAKLVKVYPNLQAQPLSVIEIQNCIGVTDLQRIIDLTERVIKLTDDIILEIEDFLTEFPKYVENRINIKRLKKFGSILKYSNADNPNRLKILKKTPEVDFQTVEYLFGTSTEEIKKRYEIGY